MVYNRGFQKFQPNKPCFIIKGNIKSNTTIPPRNYNTHTEIEQANDNAGVVETGLWSVSFTHNMLITLYPVWVALTENQGELLETH